MDIYQSGGIIKNYELSGTKFPKNSGLGGGEKLV